MAIAGKAGSVKIGTNVVTDIGDWTLNLQNDLQDISEFGDVWKSKLTALLEGTGSFNGRWDVTSTQQAALQTAMLAGTTVALRLYVNATNYYSGTAYLKSQQPKASVSGVVEVSWDFEFDGAVTYT